MIIPFVGDRQQCEGMTRSVTAKVVWKGFRCQGTRCSCRSAGIPVVQREMGVDGRGRMNELPGQATSRTARRAGQPTDGVVFSALGSERDAAWRQVTTATHQASQVTAEW